MGFCWRSLGTFCRYWQKVPRRRQKRKNYWEKWAAGGSKEKLQRVLRIATGAVRPRNDKKCVIASAFT